ncbi:MAG: hypothetical protein HQL95_00580 [Magnetococcales bacterium]|nr:hypothetical protein [Magnetococcales bacterium]
MPAIDSRPGATSIQDPANVRPANVAHDRTQARLSYLTFLGFLLVTGAILWKGVPADNAAALLVGTLAQQAYSLAKEAIGVFTGASPASAKANPAQLEPKMDIREAK